MPQLQGRLDKMWNALQMPEDQKIEMAMKYAKKEKSEQLESVRMIFVKLYEILNLGNFILRIVKTEMIPIAENMQKTFTRI